MALGALIEDLTESQALALGSLRADLPDKVEVTTKKMLLNGAARPDIIARTGANIVYHGPAFALIDFDTKGDAGHRSGRAAASRRLLAGAADGAAGPGRRGAADAEFDQRRLVARRYRGSDCRARTGSTSISRSRTAPTSCVSCGRCTTAAGWPGLDG